MFSYINKDSCEAVNLCDFPEVPRRCCHGKVFKQLFMKQFPLGTGGSNNVDVTLFQRQRRWNNVISTLFETSVPNGLFMKVPSHLLEHFSVDVIIFLKYVLFTHSYWKAIKKQSKLISKEHLVLYSDIIQSSFTTGVKSLAKTTNIFPKTTKR